MKNRAKCKLCNDIIESFHRHDYVICKCGEISVDGGPDYHRCSAGDWNNFLRIDDEGNIIIPKIVEKEPEINSSEQVESPKTESLSKKKILESIEHMIATIEGLPSHVMSTPITHYDYASLLFILSSILKLESED